MKQRSAHIVLICLFFANSICAQKVYDFNATCIQAYTEVNKLKIAPATALIAKAKQQNPQNLVPVLLDAYTDFYILFLLENPADYAQRFKNFERFKEIDGEALLKKHLTE
jgi:hypothetical protein